MRDPPGPWARRLLSEIGEAYIAADSHGHIVFWDAAAERTFGWTAAEAVGRALTDILVPESLHPGYLDLVERRRDPSRATQPLELEARHRSGRLIPIAITVTPLEHDDGEVHFHVLAHDITGRVRATQDLRLAQFIESSQDPIVTVAADGRTLGWNGAAERMFGWSRTEALRSSPPEYIPADRRDQARDLCLRAMRGDRVVSSETQCLTKDGQRLDVALTISPMFDENGELVCSLSYRNITHRKQAERELREVGERLKAQSAAERHIQRHSTVATNVELPKLGDSVAAAVRQYLGMDVALVMEVSESDHILRASAGSLASIDTRRHRAVARETTVCERMLTGEIPNAVADAQVVDSLTGLSAVRSGLRAYIGVPIAFDDGTVYGVLCAASREARTDLGARELGFLNVLARVLAEHVQVTRQAMELGREQTEVEALQALLAALDARDQYTGEHSREVVELSRAVACALGLSRQEISAVGQVAMLHDLGKVGIPDAVLRKPGPLTEAEWELMREHPAIGGRIIASIPSVAHLAPACRAEHERWDGAGYPDGLAGPQIPIAARIVLAVDAYHAMISDRPYRTSIGHLAATAELIDHRGTQFDPDVVDALIEILESIQTAAA